MLILDQKRGRSTQFTKSGIFTDKGKRKVHSLTKNAHSFSYNQRGREIDLRRFTENHLPFLRNPTKARSNRAYNLFVETRKKEKLRRLHRSKSPLKSTKLYDKVMAKVNSHVKLN
jgi:hypothetical protein